MQLVFAGWPLAGRPESQLRHLTEYLRRIGRWFIDTLNQKGTP